MKWLDRRRISKPLPVCRIKVILEEKEIKMEVEILYRFSYSAVQVSLGRKENFHEVAALVTEVVDIARGLGERVVVVGVSEGGAVTTRLARERADIDLAVPVAAFLGISFIPRPLTCPLNKLVGLMPDFHQWWDPVYQLSNPILAISSYCGNQMHALFENLRLGFAAEEDANKVKPAVGGFLVITNADDEPVDSEVVSALDPLWLENGEQFLQASQFEKKQDFPHDMIKVDRPDGHVDIVYPKLLGLIH